MSDAGASADVAAGAAAYGGSAVGVGALADPGLGEELPAGFECPGCLYDLSGLAGRVCPECGRAVWAEDFVMVRERAFARDQVGGLLLVQGLAGLGVCVVMGGGVGVMDMAPLLGVAAAGACGVAMAGSTASGWAASRLMRRVERDVWFAAWLRTQVWLHMPWLVAPATAAILVGSGWLGDQALLWTAVVGVCVWVAGVVAALVLWVGRFRRQRRRLGLRGGSSVGIAALVVFLGAVLLGLASGGYSFGLAVRVHRLGF